MREFLLIELIFLDVSCCHISTCFKSKLKKDLGSAFKIASEHIDDMYDTERVAKACEKSMPYEAAELYRSVAEESLKHSNRNAYRTAKYYFKTMYRPYTSLKKENEFRQHIDTIKSANKRKPALLIELSHI
jgi:uncharacterized Zn finger protein